MSDTRQLVALFSVLLLSFQFGCNPADPTAELEKEFSIMKTAGAEFESVLSKVEDKATAEKALPKLTESYERMFRAGRALKPLEETSSRSAAMLIKEIKDFRVKQKKDLSVEQRRVSQLSKETQEVLEPVLSRIQAHVD